jgi:hypothetical protein
MEELFVRRYRFPNVVDRFLVPATPEPLISCSLAGSAEFREREIGEAWLKRQIGPATFSSPVQRRPMKVETGRYVGPPLENVGPPRESADSQRLGESCRGNRANAAKELATPLWRVDDSRDALTNG